MRFPESPLNCAVISFADVIVLEGKIFNIKRFHGFVQLNKFRMIEQCYLTATKHSAADVRVCQLNIVSMCKGHWRKKITVVLLRHHYKEMFHFRRC